jgi:hypothetical protein
VRGVGLGGCCQWGAPESNRLSDAEQFDIDPSILNAVTHGTQRVINKGKEYLRRPGLRAARVPSIVWILGEEYERKEEKHWRS